MTTLAQYKAMLYINRHRLDDELEIQADIMDRISTQVVILNSKMIEAKDDLAQTEGRLAEDVREDEPKLTVGMIEAKVKRDPTRLRAWQKYQAARADHEAWTGLLDAWRQKGYSIRTLADLYSAQYFTMSSTQLSDRQRRRNEETDEGRASLRRAGHLDRELSPAAELPKPEVPRRRVTS